MVEGERRFRALIVVQCVASEPVAAAAGSEVVERPLQAIAAEEPLECHDGPCSVFAFARDGEGAQFGFDERRGIEGLLVAGAPRSLASAAAGSPASMSIQASWSSTVDSKRPRSSRIASASRMNSRA